MSGMLPVGFGGSVAAYDIAKSVRFRASGSAYLVRTFPAAGNRRTWTYSGWLKRARTAGAFDILLSTSVTPASSEQYIAIDNSDQLRIADGGTGQNVTTIQKFRDPSAHYHFVVTFDTTQATASDRIKMYVNGAQITSFVSAVYPALNEQWVINNAKTHDIGSFETIGGYMMDGYLSEVNFIDGQALPATSFGEFDANGVWVAKKYTGTYGTNGFYLPFSNGTSLTTLCADASGNANNWTASGVSLTAGVNYDWMDDTPTNNFATLNPLNRSQSSAPLVDGNLTFTGASGGYVDCVSGTIPVNGIKGYFEVTGGYILGIGNVALSSAIDRTTGRVVYHSGVGGIYVDGTLVQSGLATSSSSDVISVAFDGALNEVSFKKNNAALGTAVSVSGSVTWVPFIQQSNTPAAYANFGQRPFAYTPPTGFKALSTKNLPAASIENPRLHFDIALATGASIKATAEAVFPSNYLEWIKDRGNANNHQLIDTVRGSSAVLQSNTTAAETTYTAPSGSSVGWVWKAGGAAVTNTSGSVNSQVSANTVAGFSVATFTKNAASVSFGHGLGVVPHAVIVKGRGASVSNWLVYHRNANATPQNGGLILEGTTAFAANVAYWNNTAPTSAVATVGSFMPNENSVAYCFAEVPGFSKIGSYTGNGSADGPFVYCGFRPRWVLIKNASAAGNWCLHDTARSPANVMNEQLNPNLSGAEGGSGGLLDFTANGFKLRYTPSTDLNGSGSTYIFMAFAETPFQSSRAR